MTRNLGNSLKVTKNVHSFDPKSSRDAELELISLRKRWSEIASNLGFEIRTPLNSIVGMIEWLVDSDITDEQGECLLIAKDAALSLLKKANALFDYAALQDQQLILLSESYGIRELFAQLVAKYSIDCKKKNITLFCSVDDTLPEQLLGDPSRLAQLFDCLVDNAVEFTSDGGEIVIRVVAKSIQEESVEVQVSVCDNGIGIPSSIKDIVFEEFRLGDETLTREHNGCGLGLYIAGKLAKLMGGELQPLDNATGGCTMVCSFEASIPKSANSRDKRPHLLESRVAKRRQSRILVVDDDYVSRRIVRLVLERNGYLCSLAKSGEEALRCFEKEKLDLVLMDCQMPALDGFETARGIRELERALCVLPTPIVAMTGLDLNKTTEVLDRDMDAYITKPIQFEYFLATVSKLLGSSLVGQLHNMRPVGLEVSSFED